MGGATQLTFTCSKSTTEALEKGVKLKIKTHFSSVFVVDFKQVNVNWVNFGQVSFY